MNRYDWNRLTSLQVGKYAEYFVKMEFTLFGFDVYSTEVDDHGVDFVVRKGEAGYYDVQVKSARLPATSYIFLRKDVFPIRNNLLAAVVLFTQQSPPALYLIPATAWQTPDDLLRDRSYEGLKSHPEWGLNISQKNLPLLATFAFSETIQRLQN